jgi:hypothetical protein
MVVTLRINKEDNDWDFGREIVDPEEENSEVL